MLATCWLFPATSTSSPAATSPTATPQTYANKVLESTPLKEKESRINNIRAVLKPTRKFPYKVQENLASREKKQQIKQILRKYDLDDDMETTASGNPKIATKFRAASSTMATSTVATSTVAISTTRLASTTTIKLDPPYIPKQPEVERRISMYPNEAPLECLQPRDKWSAQNRPCAEGKAKWYFDLETGRCRYFNYLGCGSSANRFSTRRECEAFCVELIQDPCDSTVTNCYSKYAPTCFTEQYVPCMTEVRRNNPNEDQFYLEELYRQHCPPQVARCKSDLFKFVKLNLSPKFQNTMTPALCSQPSDIGTCQGAVGRGALRFFFDPSYHSCRVFYHSGCGGNDNHFDSFAKCMDYCGV